MTLKQLLLLTSLVLLFTLGSANKLAGEVREARQEARLAREEMKKARELSLESDKYEVQLMVVTKYAPTSPGAVPGRDYSGNPRITASGERLVPGKTAAAGENIPFGTEIYVEGEGWYTVQDRGGNIGPNNIDLACSSQEEAIAFGQKKLLVIFKPQAD
ncbi:MAG: hypothetical protein GX200_08905 [Firmicutes bacterium]|nr:hypothetical protein [Bacillota bacterium]